MAKQEYWTTFYYGGNLTFCSKHRSFEAAERAACKCESQSGAKHRIARIEWCPRSTKANKRKSKSKRSASR